MLFRSGKTGGKWGKMGKMGSHFPPFFPIFPIFPHFSWKKHAGGAGGATGGPSPPTPTPMVPRLRSDLEVKQAKKIIRAAVSFLRYIMGLVKRWIKMAQNGQNWSKKLRGCPRKNRENSRVVQSKCALKKSQMT